MKTHYNRLLCPHCRAQEFSLVKEDIFLCEYCGQKFNYNINDILSSENKIFIDELKQEFQKKIIQLNQEKINANSLFMRYLNLANPKILSTSFLILALTSLFLLFVFFPLTAITNVPIVISAICLLSFSTLYCCAKIRNKILYKKYHSQVKFYASIVNDIDCKISYYSKLISRLSK